MVSQSNDDIPTLSEALNEPLPKLDDPGSLVVDPDAHEFTMIQVAFAEAIEWADRAALKVDSLGRMLADCPELLDGFNDDEKETLVGALKFAFTIAKCRADKHALLARRKARETKPTNES